MWAALLITLMDAIVVIVGTLALLGAAGWTLKQFDAHFSNWWNTRRRLNAFATRRKGGEGGV